MPPTAKGRRLSVGIRHLAALNACMFFPLHSESSDCIYPHKSTPPAIGSWISIWVPRLHIASLCPPQGNDALKPTGMQHVTWSNSAILQRKGTEKQIWVDFFQHRQPHAPTFPKMVGRYLSGWSARKTSCSPVDFGVHTAGDSLQSDLAMQLLGIFASEHGCPWALWHLESSRPPGALVSSVQTLFFSSCSHPEWQTKKGGWRWAPTYEDKAAMGFQTARFAAQDICRAWLLGAYVCIHLCKYTQCAHTSMFVYIYIYSFTYTTHMLVESKKYWIPHAVGEQPFNQKQPCTPIADMAQWSSLPSRQWISVPNCRQMKDPLTS